MDRADAVVEFCKENKAPIQELCPEINQYFATSNGFEIWNSKTLVRETCDFDPTSWRASQDHHIINKVSVRSTYEGLYVRNIEDLGCLEIAYIIMNGGRGQDSIPKFWNYHYTYYRDHLRYFIFKDGTVYNGLGKLYPINVGGRYNKEVYKEIHSWNSIITSINNMRELQKFDSTANFNNDWRHYDDDSLYAPSASEYADWYKINLQPRSTSKLADKLLSYKFDKLDYPMDTYEAVMYYQQLDENYAVLRYLGNQWNKGEVARLFISSKGKPTLMVNKGGNWSIKGSVDYGISAKPIIINREEMETWKPLKYILPCLGNEIRIGNICDYLRHPIVEQLYKSGYKNIVEKVTSDGNIFNNLKTYFLVKKETKQPLFKMLGVNKYVLNAAERYSHNNLNIIRELKYFYGQFDISNCPEDVANRIADYIAGSDYRWSCNSITDLVRCGNRYTYNWADKYQTPLSDDERKWILKLIRMDNKENGCIETFKDAVRTYKSMDIKPEIDLYNVHNYGDIVRLHDALVQLKIQEDQERQSRYDEHQRKIREAAQKQFEKLQEKRIEKFEYENDEYCIRVPHELDEITKEGVSLHHCVGGYLNRHANGDTNIIFLRKKTYEDVPWFTIEINNDYHVVQIHGSHNRWLGNEPEAVPFVYEWLNKIGANFDNKLLLNKGAGYSAGSESLDESCLYKTA